MKAVALFSCLSNPYRDYPNAESGPPIHDRQLLGGFAFAPSPFPLFSSARTRSLSAWRFSRHPGTSRTASQISSSAACSLGPKRSNNCPMTARSGVLPGSILASFCRTDKNECARKVNSSRADAIADFSDVSGDIELAIRGKN